MAAVEIKIVCGHPHPLLSCGLGIVSNQNRFLILPLRKLPRDGEEW